MKKDAKVKTIAERILVAKQHAIDVKNILRVNNISPSKELAKETNKLDKMNRREVFFLYLFFECDLPSYRVQGDMQFTESYIRQIKSKVVSIIKSYSF